MMPHDASHRASAFVLGNFVQACCWYVDRPPASGETLEAARFQMEAGGKGLNVAVGLHRLGTRVDTLIGCGQDQAGDSLLALLASEGLAADHVHRLPGLSGWGCGLIGADGGNSIAVHLGANRLLTTQHAQQATPRIESAQLVYGQFETALPAVETAFGIAHAAGVMTVLNPSPWQTPPQALATTTHTLIVNALEAAALLGLPGDLAQSPEVAATQVASRLSALATAWPALRTLVVTLGPLGALGLERSGHDDAWKGWHAAAPTIQAVDTVGAGDAFASGFCTAALARRPLREALAWGNLCGAHVAAHPGVLAVLPNAAWLRQALANASLAVQPLAI